MTCTEKRYNGIFKLPSLVEAGDVAAGLDRIESEAGQIQARPRGLIKDRAGLEAFLSQYSETLENLKRSERIEPEWEIKSHRRLLAPIAVGFKKLLRRMIHGFVASGWERQSLHNRELDLMVDALLCEVASLRAEIDRLKHGAEARP